MDPAVPWQFRIGMSANAKWELRLEVNAKNESANSES